MTKKISLLVNCCITKKTSHVFWYFRVTPVGRWCVQSVVLCISLVWWAGVRDVLESSVLVFIQKWATTTNGSWRKPVYRLLHRWTRDDLSSHKHDVLLSVWTRTFWKSIFYLFSNSEGCPSDTSLQFRAFIHQLQL